MLLSIVSHDVDISQREKQVFVSFVLVVTYPQLDVCSTGLRDGGAEPRWVIQLAAGIVGATPLPIPQGVAGIDITKLESGTPVPSGTEVVIPHIRWYHEGPVLVCVGAVTVRRWIVVSIIGFCEGGSKGPDVLARARRSICEGDAIHVSALEVDISHHATVECVNGAHLVGVDPPAHARVGLAIDGEHNGVADGAGPHCSPAPSDGSVG